AGAGALLAHKFGRTAETDGFLAAYGVYLLLVLAAQAFRMVVVPELTRAHAEGRLAGELRAYAIAFLSFAAPVSVFVALFSHRLGDAITGTLPPSASSIAARALEVLVPAAFVQLLAALAASALAALDSYGAAAAGFAAGGVSGLVVFAALANHSGLIALAWGLAVNAAVSLAVPLVALLRKGALRGSTHARVAVGSRLLHLGQGASIPIALQVCYLLGLRLASKLGVGQVTSLTYAYLFASTLVTATAFSLGIVSSAPLTRRGFDPVEAARHVVHAAWVSLVLVGAAAGIFALVGGRLVELVLGNAYSGGIGAALGRLVVWLAPWMLAWVCFALTFPLVFVARRQRVAPLFAAAAVAVFVPVGLAFRSAWGLDGIGAALGVSTFAIGLGLMWSLSSRTLALASLGLTRLGLAIGAAAALAFGGLALALAPIPAAAVGVLVYGLIILAFRSLGLAEAWTYVRGLR
ncbi:MAG TPA: hypothetical protein VE261_03755, partial [Gaiellaceae bacterium]|nr:hypothetical protein [Gaiellaceae bacterium]